MTLTKQQEITAALGELTIRDLLDLTTTLEAQWGVEAITGGPVTVIQEVKPVTEVQTAFDVVLVDRGHNRIKVIKALRSLMGLGLQEAVQLCEALPSVLETDVSRERAEEFKERLEDTGASVTIK